MRLLVEEQRCRRAGEEAEREELLDAFPGLLGKHVPGAVVWAYGSLLVSGKLHALAAASEEVASGFPGWVKVFCDETIRGLEAMDCQSGHE